MLVEDIMTQSDKLIIVSPMGTVRDALKLMKENGVRAVIVDKTSTGGAYGLFTFKNILQSIIAEDGDIDLLNVYDIAAIPAISVSSKLEVRYASQMMINNSIKRLLVIDNNELMGILTMSDIIDSLIESLE